MKTEDIFCQLFGFSKNTYYSWKREKKPIIELLNKYFTKDELLEYIETDKISNMQLIEDFRAKEKMCINNFLSLLTLLYKKDGLDKVSIDSSSNNYLKTFVRYLHFTDKITEDTFIDFILEQSDSADIKVEIKTLLPIIVQMDECTKFIITREKTEDFINLADNKQSAVSKQAFYTFWIFWVSLKYSSLTTDELSI